MRYALLLGMGGFADHFHGVFLTVLFDGHNNTESSNSEEVLEVVSGANKRVLLESRDLDIREEVL